MNFFLPHLQNFRYSSAPSFAVSIAPSFSAAYRLLDLYKSHVQNTDIKSSSLSTMLTTTDKNPRKSKKIILLSIILTLVVYKSRYRTEKSENRPLWRLHRGGGRHFGHVTISTSGPASALHLYLYTKCRFCSFEHARATCRRRPVPEENRERVESRRRWRRRDLPVGLSANAAGTLLHVMWRPTAAASPPAAPDLGVRPHRRRLVGPRQISRRPRRREAAVVSDSSRY